MGLFEKLFGSKESRLLLSEFRKIENEGTHGATALVKVALKRRLKDEIWAKRLWADMLEEDLSVRDVVFLQILIESESSLSSGRHHIYRGILSLPGKQLESLHANAVRELRKSGFFTEEAAKECVRKRRDIIAEGG